MSSPSLFSVSSSLSNISDPDKRHEDRSHKRNGSRRIVMKFGGTSVGTLERIRAVAEKVRQERAKGHQIAVVVSAMAGVTNQMVGYCRDLSADHNPLSNPCEYDAVVASGEQVTSGLVAIALGALGIPARSFQGWQIPLLTDDRHGRANIDSVDGSKILSCLTQGIVPVMAGFQGVDRDGRIATLGRGGSDTSAVALAASIKADQCDIYTDVDGVYTTDPRIVKTARRLEHITYEEMLELASVGAKVLQTRSVALAMRENIPVRVLSSFVETDEQSGTIVVDEDKSVEKNLVAGIAYAQDDAKITIRNVPDEPGVAAAIFGPLSAGGVNVDMIVQSIGVDKSTTITFTVNKGDEVAAKAALTELRPIIGFGEIQTSHQVVKVSVVGVGMRSNTGVAATMFRVLAERGINIQVISTSEIKISVIIDAEYKELAMRALHTAYGLDAKEEEYS